MIEEERVQGQVVRVDDGRDQVLGVMEERQGAHVPGEEQMVSTSGTKNTLLFRLTHLL